MKAKELTHLYNRLKEKGLDVTYEPELAPGQVILHKNGITINFYSNRKIQVHSRNCDRLIDENIILELFEAIELKLVELKEIKVTYSGYFS